MNAQIFFLLTKSEVNLSFHLYLQDCRRTHFCCFSSPSVWYFAPAALRNQYTPFSYCSLRVHFSLQKLHLELFTNVVKSIFKFHFSLLLLSLCPSLPVCIILHTLMSSAFILLYSISHVTKL